MSSGDESTVKLKWPVMFLLLIVPLLICVGAIIVPYVRAAQFCTLNDEVYQTIETNLQTWLAYFQSLSEDQYPSLTFTVPSGKVYTVNASTWDINAEPPELFVQIEALRQEPYGLTGYVYTPTGNTTLDRRYNIEPLADDIYCYRLQ